MKRISFESGTELVLFVKKEKDGFYGSLMLGDYEINKHPAEDFKNLDLSSYESEKLPVRIKEKTLTYNNQEIITYESVFDSDKIIDLDIGKSREVAYFHIGKTILLKVSVNDLPKDLFDRRNSFKVNVRNDDEYTIVRYANLHQHTEYSLLDGIVRIKDLAKKSEYATAITDHGNMYGFLEFYKEMKKHGKKPIIGFEAYVETVGGKKLLKVKNANKQMSGDEALGAMGDDDSNDTNSERALEGHHLILLAKNETGLKNLFKMCSEAENYIYKKPHVTYEMLEKYHEGVIALSACIASTVNQAIKQVMLSEGKPELKEIHDSNEAIIHMYLEKMISIFGKEDFYIEIQDHHFELETEIMKRLRKYANDYGLKTTIGIDAHYLNKEDAKVHEMWLCQQTHKTMDDEDRMVFSGDGYHVHTSDEVLELFKDDLVSLDNTLEIADKCNVEIKSTGYHLPHYPLPEGFTSESEYLHHIAREGYKRLFAGTDKYNDERYLERMREELAVIDSMGWPAYFLIVADFIKYAQDKNVKDHLEEYFPSNVFNHDEIPQNLIKDYEVYVGSGRGSASGSLVCYCIGITKVDPIEYNLLFSRFLNKDRISMPE